MILDKKINLGFFPTPIQRLENLSKDFEGYELYIKRDDQSRLAMGGNKTRKLEYLIYDAIAKGCDSIITSGAQQSNHCRQTAAACASANLACHLLLGGTAPSEFQGNLLLSHILGADLHFMGNHRKGEDTLGLKKQLEKQGKKPYIIPYGGSNEIGMLGFINAMKELKNQLEQGKTKIDYLVFATSSGATQAGITLGNHLYNMDMHLVPINIDKEENLGKSLEDIVAELIQKGAKWFKKSSKISENASYINRDYDHSGYGVVTDGEQKAIHTLATKEGILLDPVYTGRAFYGMMDLLEKHQFSSGSKILFWHTGGLPALFYYNNSIRS